MLGCSNDAVKKNTCGLPSVHTYLFFTEVKAIYDSPYSITEVCYL